MARILCENVSKRYGSVTAVDRLNLEICDNEFMVLLGPSGCGKTTTLNIIAGLEELSDGDLLFDDTVVNFVPPHRRNIAMVFQSYALYPQKTVYENIAFGLRLNKTPKNEIDRRVVSAAAELEITHLLDRRPHQLSGGQRQRVALGRAIVRQPSVFLMDEPLSNLDASLRITMRTLIKKLHQTMRTTFVYVTHDQAEAMTLADRILLMRDGVVQQLGTPDEIYHKPCNRFVASFLGSPQMNFIEGALVRSGSSFAFKRNDLVIGLGHLDVEAGDQSDSRPVVLGLRPEDVDLQAADGLREPLRCTVGLVLPLGSEKHISANIAGEEMIFRVDKEAEVQRGDDLEFSLDPGRIHLFDIASGHSLRANAVAGA